MTQKQWATLEDFATLFQYCWYRDFPIDKVSVGARRADWTIHIGIVVRNIADLMGFVTRFEHGGRTDAVLRSTEGDEIAIEWEWGGVWGNELRKLKEHEVWSKDGSSKRPLKYAVFITYTHASDIEIQAIYDRVSKEWDAASWSLLLILVQVGKSKELSSQREFKNIIMSVFDNDERKELRSVAAVPWNVLTTRWSY